MYEVRTIVPPSTAAIDGLISVADAKKHLRVDDSDDDALIAGQLSAAVDMIERYTGQVLTAKTLELVSTGWPHDFDIPREPVTSIMSITYRAGDADVALAASAYRWSEYSPRRVLSGSAYLFIAGEVRTRFTAGYAPGAAPASLVAAVKLMLGHLYANREAVISASASELPMGIEALCRGHRRIPI